MDTRWFEFYLIFGSDYFGSDHNSDRKSGRSVRPVLDYENTCATCEKPLSQCSYDGKHTDWRNQYDWIGKTKTGSYIVRIGTIEDRDRKYGLVDSLGRIVIPVEYQDIHDVNGELVAARKEGKWGVIDKSGKIMVSFVFDYIGYDYSEGLLSAKRNGKGGYIDKNGVCMIPFEYDDWPGAFENGDVHVKKGDESFYIDKNGKRIGY